MGGKIKMVQRANDLLAIRWRAQSSQTLVGNPLTLLIVRMFGDSQTIHNRPSRKPESRLLETDSEPRRWESVLPAQTAAALISATEEMILRV